MRAHLFEDEAVGARPAATTYAELPGAGVGVGAVAPNAGGDENRRFRGDSVGKGRCASPAKRGAVNLFERHIAVHNKAVPFDKLSTVSD